MSTAEKWVIRITVVAFWAMQLALIGVFYE